MQHPDAGFRGGSDQFKRVRLFTPLVQEQRLNLRRVLGHVIPRHFFLKFLEILWVGDVLENRFRDALASVRVSNAGVLVKFAFWANGNVRELAGSERSTNDERGLLGRRSAANHFRLKHPATTGQCAASGLHLRSTSSESRKYSLVGNALCFLLAVNRLADGCLFFLKRRKNLVV